MLPQQYGSIQVSSTVLSPASRLLSLPLSLSGAMLERTRMHSESEATHPGFVFSSMMGVMLPFLPISGVVTRIEREEVCEG